MKFSVLMSVYNKEKAGYLAEALSSIWDQQKCKPDQIVLVKDGPISLALDNEIAIWKNKLGSVLDVVELEYNRGLGAALNVGLEACLYDVVARMDADDIAFPDRFEKQLKFIAENREVSVVGGECDVIDSEGQVVGHRKVPLDHDSILNALWSCPLIHPSVMFRKKDILSVGGYREDLRRRQDYELWFRCASRGLVFGNLPDILLKYRITSDSYRKNNPKLALKQAMIGYKGCRDLNLGLMPRIGVFFPFFKSVCPRFLSDWLDRFCRRFDPRENN